MPPRGLPRGCGEPAVPPDLGGRLRAVRYALPRQVERITPGPDAAAAAGICGRLRQRGFAATLGHFPGSRDTPASVVDANLALIAALRAAPGGAYLSIKMPPLGFDAVRLHAIADAAAAARLPLLFDAHAPHQADATLALWGEVLAGQPGTGCALPARWRRSRADAERLAPGTARIRVVKGEWADPDWPDADIEAGYLALVATLAGRSGTVAVATHRPSLAERALALLLEAGTPCELEQLRGLPMRRTVTIARRFGVPVRVYVPFGPGWLPYAVDKALARPYLPAWMLRDRLGLAD